jgi:hypothetical protein
MAQRMYQKVVARGFREVRQCYDGLDCRESACDPLASSLAKVRDWKILERTDVRMTCLGLGIAGSSLRITRDRQGNRQGTVVADLW